MKNLKFAFLVLAIVSMALAAIARIFVQNKIFLGLHPISYLWLTVTMLLFAIVFHLLFNNK